MQMMALVTGGASCGKSAYAEDLCMESGAPLVYLAAMRPFGEEGAARVRKHRAQRAGKGFTTIECYEGLDAVLCDDRIEGATLLLECLGNVVANELFSQEQSTPASDSEQLSQPARAQGEALALASVTSSDLSPAPDAESAPASALGPEDIVVHKLERQILVMRDCCRCLVVVGNEVGSDGISYAPETQAYQRVLGRLSCLLAAHSDVVAESVAGIPVVLKDSEVVA